MYFLYTISLNSLFKNVMRIIFSSTFFELQLKINLLTQLAKHWLIFKPCDMWIVLRCHWSTQAWQIEKNKYFDIEELHYHCHITCKVSSLISPIIYKPQYENNHQNISSPNEQDAHKTPIWNSEQNLYYCTYSLTLLRPPIVPPAASMLRYMTSRSTVV